MKTELPPDVERCRISGDPGTGSGAFKILCPVLHRTLTILASDGRDWGVAIPRLTAEELAEMPSRAREIALKRLAGRESITLPLPAWEHVSVSASTCPTWAEMCWVKSLFWGEDECVIQFHPPASTYVNDHPRCLHLWRVVGKEFPVPPVEAV